MAGSEAPILLDDEIEGECEGTGDIFFFQIGAVPLKPSDFKYDMEDSPKRPMALSERFGLLFIGHSEGFFVAKTKAVIELAKENQKLVEMEKKSGVKDGHKCPTVQEASIVNVLIGRVSILALSADSMTLAATVGGEIHLFSIASLVRKNQNPIASCSPGKSGFVRDLLWIKSHEKHFIVLFTCGSLFHGDVDGHLTEVMDDVDAVDWSGDLLAVAKNNTLRILSAKFETSIVMELSFECKGYNAEVGQMKVDSIKWMTNDNIIVGCMLQDENGVENDYLLYAVMSRENGFKASSKPMVVSFLELFHGMGDQVSDQGPYLHANYLDRWKLAVLANRKNMDDHIVLLKLHMDDQDKKPVVLELEQELHTPRIGLQENGDENVILGLCVDKNSVYEKVNHITGEEVRELSPYCILFCLTSEGKIILFHVARGSDPPAPLPTVFEVLDGEVILEEDSTGVPSATTDTTATPLTKHDSQTSSVELMLGEKLPSAFEVKKVDDSSELPAGLPRSETPATELVAVLPSKQGFGQSNGNLAKPSIHTFRMESPGTLSSPFSSVNNAFGKQVTGGGDFTGPSVASLGWTSSYSVQGTLGPRSSGKLPFYEASNANFSSSSTLSMSIAVDSKNISTTHTQLPSSQSIVKNIADGSKTGASALKEDPDRGKLTRTVGKSLLEDRGQYKSPELNFSSELSDNLYDVTDMVKALDRLLFSIERDGGFADACISHLKNSVLVLEKGLESLSEELRSHKVAIAELVGKVNHLQDKKFQVSAREEYMQGVVEQASNSQYWDVWNRRELGPEFELMQAQIGKANQGLRSQLIELERHFNVLELNRFGESSGPSKGQRATGTSESLRRIQTVHRLHNTVVSQLSVAEHLSDSLTEQMDVLNIASPSAKQRNITREMLESIGVVCPSESFESPDIKGTTPYVSSAQYLPPTSVNLFGETVKKYKSSKLKELESETGRRRRDSLDRSLASFEPQKTTVKRMLQHERSRINTHISSTKTEEPCGTDAKGGLSLQNKAVEMSKFPSFQPFMHRTETSTNQAGRKFPEGFPKQMSNLQTGSMSKGTQDFPAFTQSAAELKNRKVSDRLVPRTSNALSTPVSASTVYVGIQEKTGVSVLAENMGSKEAHVGQFFPSSTIASTVLNASTNVDRKMLTNDTPQKFLNSVPLEKLSVLETRPKSNTIMVRSMSEHAGLSSSSTVTIKPNQDAALFNRSGKSPTIDKGDIPKTDALSGDSGLVDVPSGSLGHINFPLSGALTKPPFSSAMPAQKNSSFIDVEKNPNASNLKQSTTTALSSSSSTTSSPMPLSSQVLPASTISSISSAVSQPAIVSSADSTPLSVAVSSSLAFPGFNYNPFSSASISSNPALTSFSTDASSSLAISSPFASSSTAGKEKDNVNFADTQEDEMEEEAPDATSILNLGGLGGFGVGSTPTPSAPKASPFGGSFAPSASTSSPFSSSTSPGQLFKPASFSIPSIQPVQSSQPIQSSGASGGFGGFGQPAQVGVGQQALGSVLGSFGQSRQLGSGLGFGLGGGGNPAAASPASSFSSSGFAGSATGGFAAAASLGGGFASAATGGGFAAAASVGGGFAGAATGGGFGAAASNGMGFAGAGSGFAGAAAGGGFAGAASGGGFAALGPSVGGFAGAAGGFAGAASSGSMFGSPGVFGSGSASGNKPPAELLMKMRK